MNRNTNTKIIIICLAVVLLTIQVFAFHPVVHNFRAVNRSSHASSSCIESTFRRRQLLLSLIPLESESKSHTSFASTDTDTDTDADADDTSVNNNSSDSNSSGTAISIATAGQHLCTAGTSLQSASIFVGSGNPTMAGAYLLKEAGLALEELGQYWTTSWEAVTYAAEDSSMAFHALARAQPQQGNTRLASLYSRISNELTGISDIVGCISVGPPMAVPHLVGMVSSLLEIAQFVEREHTYDYEENDNKNEKNKNTTHSQAFATHLREASTSLQQLIDLY